MARWTGKIGFTMSVEDPESPSEWISDSIVERTYYGDVIHKPYKIQSNQDSTVDNIVVNVDISVVADKFLGENFIHMTYVTYMGQKWKISSIVVNYPRMTLMLGGLYHG